MLVNCFQLAISRLALLAVLFSLGASPAHALLNNGNNAEDLLGHFSSYPTATVPNFTTTNAVSPIGFAGASDVTMDTVNHRLFVSDNLNNRILVFTLNSDNTIGSKEPVSVLGQTDFFSSAAANTQSGLNSPRGLAYDSTNQRLFVAEGGGNRVKVFDVASISDGENAVNVLGQADFTSSSAATTQARMSAPFGVEYDSANQRLFVADSSNHRVLVFDVATITDGENAINVLGQANFTTGSAANSSTRMSNPRGVIFDSARNYLFVSQQNNHRITVYDITTITDGEAAINVLGQTNFTNSSAADAQNRLRQPFDMAYDSTNKRLFVGDAGGHRVKIFDITAITDGENAANILGQSTWSGATASNSQSGVNNPYGLYYDNGNQLLFVAEDFGDRVKVFDVASITDNENAVDLLGMYDSASSTSSVNYFKSITNNKPNERSFSAPDDVLLDHVNHRLFVTDSSNNRILVFNLNTDNSLTDRDADNVLGQTDFIGSSAANTQAGLNNPRGIAFDNVNNRLFVCETTANRIKVYDLSGGITNGMNASNILGQSTWSGTTANTTQAGVNNCRGLDFSSERQWLFDAERAPNRTKIYDMSGGISDNMNATYVLGQANFTSSTSATTQAGAGQPHDVAYDPSRQWLFVTEWTNHRITVYDLSGTVTNGMNASYVLGQPNFTTATSSATTSTGTAGPTGITFDINNKRIFVTETNGSNKVKVWDVASITNGEPAINVLGQSSFSGTAGATTQSGFSGMISLFYSPHTTKLYVADTSNNRIMIFDGTTISSSMQGLFFFGP